MRAVKHAWSTREKMFACVKCAQYDVVFTHTVAHKGIATANKRKPWEKTDCAQCSFWIFDDRQVFGEDDLNQVVEEDDSEEDHHTQSILGQLSTYQISETVVLVVVELVGQDEL